MIYRPIYVDKIMAFTDTPFTERITSEKTRRREYDRLLDIRDNYPKYVLRTDDFVGGNFEGIKTMHVADFLLSDEY